MIRAIDRKMIRDFLRLRAQTATVALLVACGVSLLVSAWSAYSSLKDSRDVYYRDYAFAEIFAEIKRAPSHLSEIISRIPGIRSLETRIVIDGLVDVPTQDEPALGRFVSVPSGKQPILNQMYLRQGRLPTDSDPQEVVVHEGFAIAHQLKPGDQISALIQGRREKLTISGLGLSPEYVYALSPAAPLPDDRHFGVFWIPAPGLERMAGMADSFNSVTAVLMPGASAGAVQHEMSRLLEQYGNRSVHARDRQLSNMFVEDEIAQQRVSAIAMPAIFLGVAAFLIHVVSSRLISIHRPQIAALKAMGYKNRRVAFHYIKLVLLMSLSGALPGLVLGAWLGEWMARAYEGFFRFPSLDFSLNGGAVLIGLTSGVLPGALGAWASIRSAFQLPPAEAMRPPSPPAFHATLLERSGMQKRLSIPMRMVFRNLLLRPYRLFASILGVSLSLAIIVTSGFWMDSISFLLNTQFQLIQREDLSVSLHRPAPVGALREIQRLPGVLAAEGYRVVPVRIRHLNHQREIALTGWPPHARMRAQLDRALTPVSLPKEGLVLSEYFRKHWGLRLNEEITLELLEGHPREISLRIAGFSTDLVGLSASMRIDQLWSSLGEQPAYNLMTVQADPREISRLYVRLKETPEVAAINLKTALYRGFESSMGTMIRTTTLVLIGFSLAIALGVIYNSVRVSFSERAWEMASLRVIGFRSPEVFALLLLEVTLQVLAAILPGCLFGFLLAYLSLQLIHTETFGFPIIIRHSTYALSILVILAALALSAWVIFRLTSRLSLAEALKARD